MQTNFPYFVVKVTQGAETDRALSVGDSGKAIPWSLPIIYIHVSLLMQWPLRIQQKDVRLFK